MHGTERVRKRNRGRVRRKAGTRGRQGKGREGEGGEEERTGMTRKRRGIRDFVCLPVGPSEPEGTSAAANLEEELGRETNTSAGETTAGKEGDSTNSRIG